MSHHEYAISYPPLSTALQSIDVQALIDQAGDPWYIQTLIQVGDVLVRLGVMQGEFHWHKHDQQDESFFVLPARSSAASWARPASWPRAGPIGDDDEAGMVPQQ